MRILRIDAWCACTYAPTSRQAKCLLSWGLEGTRAGADGIEYGGRRTEQYDNITVTVNNHLTTTRILGVCL